MADERVEAMASTAWTSSTIDRDHPRGVLVRRHAEQRHEGLAGQRVVDRHHADREYQKGQPAEHPADLRVGQPRRPLVGGAAEAMRAANWAYTRATRIWPTAAMVHSQMPDRAGGLQHVVVGPEDADRRPR